MDLGEPYSTHRIDQSRYHMPVVGRVAVTLLIFMILRVVFGAWSVPLPVVSAIGGVICLEGVWLLLRRYRHRRVLGQAEELKAQLHTLEQIDFDLRYEQAKRDGALDRFKPPSE